MHYEEMAQRALRGVVREALERAAGPQGLPGDHHFYITFKTHHPGVQVAPYLEERYPEDMTIVLEHQFWDLKVGESEFSVGLSFSQTPETIVVPFAAITRFYDPSVHFGLQFVTEDEEAKGETPGEMSTMPTSLPSAASGGAAAGGASSGKQGEEAGAEAQEHPEANVVSLDAFRKKS
jgi:hypothetical protein